MKIFVRVIIASVVTLLAVVALIALLWHFSRPTPREYSGTFVKLCDVPQSTKEA